jgi:sulfatase maturation enzyme AslB (radical SAM superfamily)
MKCFALEHSTFYSFGISNKLTHLPCCKFSKPPEKKDGVFKECLSCEKIDNGGGVSLKSRLNQLYQQSPQLIYLDLCLLNTCNLACKTCSSKFSSRWRSYDEAFGRESYPKVDLPFDDLKGVLDKDQYFFVKVWGGEPLLKHHLDDCINFLSEKGDPSKIKLLFITNQTQLVSQSHMELLNNFNEVNFVLSIDGDSELNPYIRDGVTANKIKKFIENTSKLNNVKYRSNTVVSLLNVNKIKEVDKFLTSLGILDKKFDLLDHPDFLNISNLDPVHRDVCLERVKDIPKLFNLLKVGFSSKMVFSKKVELQSFLKSFYELDGMSLRDFNPELYNWLVK